MAAAAAGEPAAAPFDAARDELAPLLSAGLAESPDAYAFRVDLPGVSDRDLDISISNACLLIQAERRAVREQRTANAYRIERRLSKVQRKIRLPPDADPDGVWSELRGSLLSVTFPKKALRPAKRRLAIVEEQ